MKFNQAVSQEIIKQTIQFEADYTEFNNLRSLEENEGNFSQKTFGSTLALRDINRNQSNYLNRVLKFNYEDIEYLEEIISYYEEINAVYCFEINPLYFCQEISLALLNEGFFPAGKLIYLINGANYQKIENKEIKIELVTKDSVDYFLYLIAKSDEMDSFSDIVLKKCSRYYYQDNFKCFIAYYDEQPAAMATVYIKDNLAYIANAFTFEEHRNKGLHKALLQHRCNEAYKAGAEYLISDVAFGSNSHANLEKVGFKTLYTSDFWIKRS